MVCQPILIGFFSLRSGALAASARGAARLAAASEAVFNKLRRVIPRRGAMDYLRQRARDLRADDRSGGSKMSKSARAAPKGSRAPAAPRPIVPRKCNACVLRTGTSVKQIVPTHWLDDGSRSTLRESPPFDEI